MIGIKCTHINKRKIKTNTKYPVNQYDNCELTNMCLESRTVRNNRIRGLIFSFKRRYDAAKRIKKILLKNNNYTKGSTGEDKKLECMRNIQLRGNEIEYY